MINSLHDKLSCSSKSSLKTWKRENPNAQERQPRGLWVIVQKEPHTVASAPWTASQKLMKGQSSLSGVGDAPTAPGPRVPETRPDGEGAGGIGLPAGVCG